MEGDLLKRMMLSVTFQKCPRNISFSIAHKAGLQASHETRLISQTETWFVTPDSIPQLDHPTYLANFSLNVLELFLKRAPPSEDARCQRYLSKTHLGSCASVALSRTEN